MDEVRSVPKDTADAEILAIRTLISEEQSVPEKRPERAGESNIATQRKSDRLPAIEPVEEPRVAMSERLKSGRVAQGAGVVTEFLWTRIKAYRPQRKSILLTSLVLLLVLQPGLVFGWTLAFISALAFCYFVMGGDAFWRKVVTVFKAWERRQPAPARGLKLRAYLFSKKWQKLLSKFPDRMTDALQLPELRGLLAADEKHDAALTARLNSLR